MRYLIAILLLSGCASLPQGVVMTDEDRAICAAEGCTVWTQGALHTLIGIAARHGFDAGKKQRGQSL